MKSETQKLEEEIAKGGRKNLADSPLLEAALNTVKKLEKKNSILRTGLEDVINFKEGESIVFTSEQEIARDAITKSEVI